MTDEAPATAKAAEPKTTTRKRTTKAKTDDGVERTATTLIGKLAEAFAESADVVKSSTNKDQGYKFASAESILQAVRMPLLSRGVVMLPTVVAVESAQITSRNGSTGESITVTIDFDFLDGSTGEVHSIKGWRGRGQDYGDKAFGKAYTNAIKTVIRTAWLLPTGDDPEDDSPEAVAHVAPQQVEVPPWAQTASAARKKQLLAKISEYIGDDGDIEAAKKIAITIGERVGAFPDALVEGIIAVLELIDIENGIAPSPEAEAAAAEQDADAEAADVPHDLASVDIENAVIAASIDLPDLEGIDDALEQEAVLRDAGCTCPDPVVENFDSGCPLKTHGIPL